ncbi:MAG: NAD(P)-dependent oxidoreductase, partial [Dehalococcoidia bacterium]|nr:NAD(P)-dependent oxidoreductase [Dehalococcoidia bacterium]
MVERIGFVGAGTMGKPMVKNLLRAGYSVTLFARTPAKVAELVALGAHIASSSAEVGAASDVVITNLPNGPEVLEVVTGPRGVLDGMTPGGLVIDMGTIAPAVSRAVSAMCAAKRIGFLDAPVSGGPSAAEQGTLTIMVGGDAADVERARPILNLLGNPDNVIHVGPVGTGQVVKLVNNMLAAIIVVATGEAFAVGAKAGVDVATMARVVGVSSGASWQLANAFPARVFSGSPDVSFALDLIVKDIGLARELATQVGAPTPLLDEALRLYRAAQERGLGSADY